MRKYAMVTEGALLLLLSGVASAPAEVESAATGRWCAKVDVLIAGAKKATPNQVFSATSVKDIAFAVSFAPQWAGEALDLAVYTPNGHLYQRLRVMPLAVAHGRRQGATRLPVSGTLIVNSSLYGEWRVEPELAGSAVTCGRPERFTIAE